VQLCGRFEVAARQCAGELRRIAVNAAGQRDLVVAGGEHVVQPGLAQAMQLAPQVAPRGLVIQRSHNSVASLARVQRPSSASSASSAIDFLIGSRCGTRP